MRIFKNIFNKNKGKNNKISKGSKINLHYKIRGNNNEIKIEGGSEFGRDFNIFVKIFGDNNRVIIKKPYNIKNLLVNIENHVPINNCTVLIGELTSMVDVKMLVFQHNSCIRIGKNCTFSRNIQIRTGELPHFIFDIETGEYLDKNTILKIGNHVWIGENSMILKNASIADDNIIGCNSVVTKKFDENNSVIAGNPAKIRKRGVKFIKNDLELQNYPKYFECYKKFLSDKEKLI